MNSGPDYIQFYPTLRCNRSCGFCFNRGLPHSSDTTIPQFTRMIGVLSAAGTRTLDILGGEPTLHPDLSGFIALALDHGFTVNLSSNGSDPGALGEILDQFPAVNLGISVNDLDAARALEAFIRTRRPVVKSVMCRELDPALPDLLLSFNPRQYVLLFRDAMAAEQLADALSFDHYRAALRRLTNERIGMVYCSGFLPDREYPALQDVRCPAGTTKLGMLPDGSVYPCNLFFGREDFLLGNILNDPFEHIWQHEKLDFFRTYRANSCPRRSCELHAACHGGCPAHSLLHEGSCSAPDPRCLRGVGAEGISKFRENDTRKNDSHKRHRKHVRAIV
ncbi:MAG: radical SAM/SPASM domain-containing protein [Nitrospiraceae bacterium]|nr:radical SAM/SPASM domain-containing protein [Nitrospiraceae bacterium]